ncbi:MULTISPECIES: disulfide bond formation protein B [Sphingomonas]|uniref:disulfide bond formation protein B n=1 Tax=Sphingomonas TaxID=13687 RepID=UPI000DF019BB|nr:MULTISPECIES: disulfide bond formation protein B [Sphingomonas]
MDARTGSLGLGSDKRSLDRALWLALLVPGGLLAGAYASQIFGGLHPCEMCWWQRYGHFAGLTAATLALLLPPARRPLLLLAALGIAVSGAIAVYHAGVEARWWEGFTTCTATGAKTLQDILRTPLIRCDQVQWSFLGLSMAAWNAIFSLSAAGAIAWLTLRRR